MDPCSDCILCLFSADRTRPGCALSPSARSLESWLASLPDLGVVDALFAHIDVGFQFFDADDALYAVNRLVINDRCFAGSAINEEAYRQLAARRVLVERHCQVVPFAIGHGGLGTCGCADPGSHESK